jgi:D-3-phosphoglycerate dehydrogenase
VGKIGTFLGDHKVNIAGLQLGRERAGGMAVSLFNVDQPVQGETLELLRKLPNIKGASYLTF